MLRENGVKVQDRIVRYDEIREVYGQTGALHGLKTGSGIRISNGISVAHVEAKKSGCSLRGHATLNEREGTN